MEVNRDTSVMSTGTFLDNSRQEPRAFYGICVHDLSTIGLRMLVIVAGAKNARVFHGRCVLQLIRQPGVTSQKGGQANIKEVSVPPRQIL